MSLELNDEQVEDLRLVLTGGPGCGAAAAVLSAILPPPAPPSIVTDEMVEAVGDAADMANVWIPGVRKVLEAAVEYGWTPPQDAILNPPPEFDPGALEALHSYDGTGLAFFPDDCLRHVRKLGLEMVETTELEALREFTALLFEGEEPELTDDELAYGIYFSDHLTDAQFYAPLSSAQRDAIRKAKEAQR